MRQGAWTEGLKSVMFFKYQNFNVSEYIISNNRTICIFCFSVCFLCMVHTLCWAFKLFLLCVHGEVHISLSVCVCVQIRTLGSWFSTFVVSILGIRLKVTRLVCFYLMNHFASIRVLLLKYICISKSVVCFVVIYKELPPFVVIA